METTNLPKPIKMTIKTTDIITKNSEVLFRRLELLHPVIKTTYWKLVDKLQRTAAYPAYRSGVSKDPEKDESSCLQRSRKGHFEDPADSSGRKAVTTLTADQDEGAMEPMDVQATEPCQNSVDDGASVSSHI